MHWNLNDVLFRETFVEYGKHSKAIKEYLEKVEREGHTNRRHSMPDTGKVDKATAAFQVTYLTLSLIGILRNDNWP